MFHQELVHTVLERSPAAHQADALHIPFASTALSNSSTAIDNATDSLSMLLAGPGPSKGFASSSTQVLETMELLVHGNATVHGALQYNQAIQLSDARLKENVIDAPAGALQKLAQLRPVMYNLLNTLQQQQQVGFIAQDVQDVFPDAVVSNQLSGLLGINPYVLLAYAIRGIQQLHEQVQLLRSPTGQVGSPQIQALQAEDQTLAMQLLQLQANRAQQPAHKQSNADADSGASCDSQEASSTVLDTANSMASSSHNTVTPEPAASSSHNTGAPDTADSAPMHSAEFRGLANANDIVQYMMTVLQERDTNLAIKFHKSLDRVGKSAVWSRFQAAVPDIAAPPGATTKLMRLLKQ